MQVHTHGCLLFWIYGIFSFLRQFLDVALERLLTGNCVLKKFRYMQALQGQFFQSEWGAIISMNSWLLLGRLVMVEDGCSPFLPINKCTVSAWFYIWFINSAFGVKMWKIFLSRWGYEILISEFADQDASQYWAPLWTRRRFRDHVTLWRCKLHWVQVESRQQFMHEQVNKWRAAGEVQNSSHLERYFELCRRLCWT